MRGEDSGKFQEYLRSLCQDQNYREWHKFYTPTDAFGSQPVGGRSGNREADLITDLNIWNRQTQLGKVFSSATIFRLPQGGDRSPDAAWVKLERWEALTEAEQDGFPPICPDFVIELRSRTDALKPLQDKMWEYLNSGLRLGWLINPQNRQVEIYRPNQDVEIVQLPASLSGENVLPGFVLNLPIL